MVDLEEVVPGLDELEALRLVDAVPRARTRSVLGPIASFNLQRRPYNAENWQYYRGRESRNNKRGCTPTEPRSNSWRDIANASGDSGAHERPMKCDVQDKNNDRDCR